MAKTEADSLEEQQLGKLGEEEDEEEEPATERRREYTDLGLDLSERAQQVACHTSVLAWRWQKKHVGKWRFKSEDFHRFCEWQRKPYIFH